MGHLVELRFSAASIRSDTGCHTYNLLIGKAVGNTFWLVQKWINNVLFQKKLQYKLQMEHPVHWPRPCVSNDAASAACWA